MGASSAWMEWIASVAANSATPNILSDWIDILTIQYDTNGIRQWIRTFDGTQGDFPADAVSIGENGIVLVGSALIGNHRVNALTVRYDALGNILWQRVHDDPPQRDDEAKAVQVDEAGNVYVVGTAYEDFTGSECLTVRYDPQGNQVWSEQFGTPGMSGWDYRHDLALDSAGNIYVTGKHSVGSESQHRATTLKYTPDGALSLGPISNSFPSATASCA